MKSLRCFPVALALTFALATPALAAPADKASELMNQGVARYAKGNLEGARQAFLEAFELAPHHTIASNLAEVEIKLGRYREASEHLNYVLRSLPPSASDERASSEKDLAECRQRLSVVRVAVSVQGAAVMLDGKELGTAPLETELWLEPGEYVVEARHTGYLPASERVVTRAGESREISLALGVLPAETPAASGTEHRRDEVGSDSGMETKTLVLIGGSVLTVAAASVGTVFLLKSGAAADDVDKALAEIANEEPELAEEGMACRLEPSVRPAACATLSSSQQDEKTFKNVAIGSFIAAGALGVGTLATYFLWPETTKAEGRSESTRRRVAVMPWLGPEARGVTLELPW